MNRYIRLILFIGLPLVIIIFLLFQGHQWARNHVDYLVQGEPHPINCIPCHIYPVRDGLFSDILNEDYLSPLNIAVSSEGSKLYVTAQDGNALIVANVDNGDVITKIAVGDMPHSVVLSKNDKTAYVSNQWSNNISVIDLENNKVIDTIEVGGGPAGMAIDPDSKFLYVANTYTSNLSVVDLENGKEKYRLFTGNNPMSVTISPDQKTLLVTSRRTIPIPFRTPPKTEVTIIDVNSNRVKDRLYFTSAHIMENAAFTPSGDLAFITLVRPKNLVPSAQIEQGWMMNHGIGIIEQKENGRMAQLLLDEPNSFYPDPFDIVISKDGKYAFISHSGVDHVSVVSIDKIRKLLAEADDEVLAQYANHLGLSFSYVIKRLPTGPNPKGLALSPDGSHLYVAERYSDKIAVFDTKTFENIDHIDLDGPKRITMNRHGGRLFNNAGRTFHNQYSCYTCHPDGSEDGLIYDLVGNGRNLANVQTLRDLYGTSPFKWMGTNQSVYKQCGMRFSMFVTRTEVFPPDDLNALVAFMMLELTHPPNLYMQPDGKLTPRQQRGKEFFERTVDNFGNPIAEEDRCLTCHPSPNFTDRMMQDVGTVKEWDDVLKFDTPNLNNIYESAPYLHDGSAPTLEEIWTVFAEDDEHGRVNDFTKDNLNDLIEYLKCLGAERYYQDENVLESKF